MKLISWNVNGLRSCMGKGFADFMREAAPDAICLQEIKMQQGQLELDFGGYDIHLNSAERKGYSGTALFTRRQPLSVSFGIGDARHDTEGRVICADYGNFYLVTAYTPNSQDELRRLDYRMEWDDAFRQYVTRLDSEKPVVICGDLNVAHREIDLKNPKPNVHNAGFTPQEREKLGMLIDSGFVDSFRYVNGDITGAYSWWSYMGGARERNAGWRIDYFLVSCRAAVLISDAWIMPQVFGSDHCPVGLEIDF